MGTRDKIDPPPVPVSLRDCPGFTLGFEQPCAAMETLECVQMPALIYNEAGVVISVNKAFEMLTGYMSDDVIGRGPSYPWERQQDDIYTTENISIREDANKKTYQSKKGDILVVIVSRAVCHIKPEKKCRIETWYDITRDSQTEEHLRDSEKHYRRLVENISDILYEFDENGYVTYVSPSVRQFLGYEPSEVIGWHVRRFVADSAHDYLKKNISRIKNGDDTASEYPLVTKTGDIKWSALTSRPVYKSGSYNGFQGIAKDITSLKKTQEQLEGSVRAVRSLINSHPQSVVLVDPSGMILDCNEKFALLLGTSSEDAVGKNLFGFVLDTFCFLSWSELSDVFSRRGSIEYEIDLNGRDIHHHLIPLFDDAGGISAVSIFIEDRTDQKLQTQRIYEAEKLYHSIFENAGTAIFMVGVNYNIIKVNAEFEKLTGYAKGEVEGKLRFEHVVHPSESERVVNYRIDRLEKGLSPPAEYEVLIQSKTGQLLTVFTRVHVIPGTKHLIVSLQDVTAIKKVQEQILQREKQLRAFLDHIPDLAWLKDTESRIVMANRAFEELTGIAVDDVTRKDPDTLFPKDISAQYRENDKRVMAEVQTLKFEERIPCRDGSIITAESIKSPYYDADGVIAGTVGTAHDISEWKQRMKELHLQQEKLEKIVARDRDELRHINKYLAEKQKELAQKSREQRRVEARLDETKGALNVLVTHLEEIRQDTERHLLGKIRTMLRPIVEKMQKKSEMSDCLRELQEIYQLAAVDSVYDEKGHIMVPRFLTPSELQIASMIRNGMTNDEIAAVLHISVDTVKTHRKNMRKKLNIRGTGISLARYLETALEKTGGDGGRSSAMTDLVDN